MTYGLGWFQHDYNGKMVQFHTGSLAGMVAIAGMIPEENIGVYVMGNLDHVELRHAIMYTVFDLFTEGAISRDWSNELYTLYHKDSETPKAPVQVKDANPNIAETNLIGTFYNALLGWIKISKKDNQLYFNINDTLTGLMNHWNYDTYKGVFDKKEYGSQMFSFRMGPDGDLSYLELYGERFNRAKH